MENPEGITIRKIDVRFEHRWEIRKSYLIEPEHGGLIVPAPKSVKIGEEVELRVRCLRESREERILGKVLWCRREGSRTVVGVGLLAGEEQKCDRLMDGDLPTSPGHAERRERRFQARLKVTYRTARGLTVDYTRNLSRGGMFIERGRSLSVGSKLPFKIYPSVEQEPIELNGEVSWQRSGGGLGVRFTDFPLSTRSRLALLLRSMTDDDQPPEDGSSSG